MREVRYQHQDQDQGLFEDDGSAAKTETIDLISGEHVEGIQSTDGIVVPSHPAALFLRISDA